jgi:non-ribosomal peptide synthase protein (TIGR01720 family)
VRSHTFQLDEEQTQLLLGECNKAYRTQVNELLLSALLLAYREWTGSGTLCLQMEGHGREEVFGHLDTSETVGWFTSVYPLVLTSESGWDVGTLIKSVKEQYRGLPNRGFGYGVLSEVLGDEGLREAGARLATESVEFNYLGQFDGTLNETTAFRAAKEPAGASSAAGNPASAPVSVNAMVREGRLIANVNTIGPVSDAALLAESFRRMLGDITEHCHRIAEAGRLAEEYESVFIAANEELGDAEIEL